MEGGCQVLQKSTEVHAAVGREVEDQLAAVEGVLGLDQLHVQPVLPDLLSADVIGFPLPGPVFRGLIQIDFIGRTDDGVRADVQLVRIHQHGRHDDAAHFDSADSLDDNLVPDVEVVASGPVIELLSGIAEADADHLDLLFTGFRIFVFFLGCLRSGLSALPGKDIFRRLYDRSFFRRRGSGGLLDGERGFARFRDITFCLNSSIGPEFYVAFR